MTPRFLILTLLLLPFATPAQDAHIFKRGLAAGPVHRYGREALVHDLLAHQMMRGEFAKPQAGATLLTDEKGKAVAWQTVDADTAGRFRGEALSNGYLYLTYEAPAPRAALLHVSGNSMCYVNGEPRGGDIYRDGWMKIPVMLRKGTNEILVRCGMGVRWQGITARLLFPEKGVSISTDDATLPHLVPEERAQPLWGAVVITNATAKPLTGLRLVSVVEGKEMSTPLAAIPPLSLRKAGFQLDPAGAVKRGAYGCRISLRQGATVLDEKTVDLEAVNSSEHHSYTFISAIDGSVQYYSVAPQVGVASGEKASALFLSVHGAGVQAIGQARAYKPKDWGVLVAPTNRRPRGFNWEDWGRLDALEVFELAKQRYRPDADKIYLTGHSMGGHGTWYLGATYPDKWAAIAPCAGYPTLTGYGSADGKIPEAGRSGIEKLLLRASNPSNVIELHKNYAGLGVYIHHGDSDKVVSVDYARQMRSLLGGFHKDFSYYEYPGGGHWFGDQSVDWPPLFEYFKWHRLAADSAVSVADFTTASPAISSQYRWVSILQQQHMLAYSRVKLVRNTRKPSISGTTQNVQTLRLSLAGFEPGKEVLITLDGEAPVRITVPATQGDVWLAHDNGWHIVPGIDAQHKGTVRNGTFKEPFNHRMVFVYGTKGNAGENQWAFSKARYDAEVWYYRGNGAVDMVADVNFTPAAYADRGVVLYGNSATNAAWKKLLAGCPVQLGRSTAQVGAKRYTGDDIGAYFMWPRPDSKVASIAVIGGTGLQGMKATEANQYFAAGSGFPDFMLFTPAMFRDGAKGLKTAGFYGNDWTIEHGEVEEQE